MTQNLKMFDEVIAFVKNLFGNKEFIPLHEPVFGGNEKQYVIETIDSTFVSSVGKFVDKFEEMICNYTGAKYAIATVNGTSALHMALLGAGVSSDDEVITQALTFVATANAISYCRAQPVFVDVDKDTLGMSPDNLRSFLKEFTISENGVCKNKLSGKRISAVVPMHTFGFACRIQEIRQICDEYHLPLVEDSAESIGTWIGNKHTGTFGSLGVFSFNGNKTITCGGGGVIVTDDGELAKKLKHMTTTAKVPHKWEYVHDMIGYNYRMPNINAALACAQLEQLEAILTVKRALSAKYQDFFNTTDISFVEEIEGTRANYWLNTIVLKDQTERDLFLEKTNSAGVMTRPIWHLLNDLTMFKECYSHKLEHSSWLSDRIVNLPSSVNVGIKI